MVDYVHSVHSVCTHVHPSKGNYNKDAGILIKKLNSFDIDLFYNPLNVR